MKRSDAAGPNEPTILAGFDGTEAGLDAVALGRQLAEATGSRLVVAHVYPYNVLAAQTLAVEPRVEEELTREAEGRLRRAEPLLADLERWDTRAIAAIPPARGLHDVAEELDARLVVIGSTHRHGLGRIVSGTTAEKLLHGSPFPVAVAPAGWRSGGAAKLETVGFAFDGSEESAGALAAAVAFANEAGAALRVIVVFQPPIPANPLFAMTSHGYHEIVHDLRADLKRRLDEAVATLPAGMEVRAEVLDGDPLEVLERESAGLDVLAAGSRGYGALRSVLLGSLTRRLASHSRCPLLVVPRGAERLSPAAAAVARPRGRPAPAA